MGVCVWVDYWMSFLWDCPSLLMLTSCNKCRHIEENIRFRVKLFFWSQNLSIHQMGKRERKSVKYMKAIDDELQHPDHFQEMMVVHNDIRYDDNNRIFPSDCGQISQSIYHDTPNWICYISIQQNRLEESDCSQWVYHIYGN